MLIDSPRLSPADRQHWASLEHYDDALSASSRLDQITTHALEIIAGFAADYVSISWGKDSVVVADLCGHADITAPLVWMRIDGYDMPECEQVRDQILTRYPRLRYEELTLPPQPNRWWDDGISPQSKHDADIGWRLIADRHGHRRITGIRAEESRIRRIIQARDGDASRYACRPIGRWTAVDVFAYLHKHDLPIHPAYAMSHGGRLDRRWLRVHSLGGVTGADRGRAEWETHYYGDIITASRTRTQHLTEPVWTVIQ